MAPRTPPKPRKPTKLPTFEKQFRQATRQDVAASQAWLVNKVNFLRKLSPIGLLTFANAGILKDRPEIGSMYFYFYDAKYKEELTVWDKFPLMIPIDWKENGNVLGLNLHYLPPRQRFLLLDRLMDFANNKKLDQTTRLRLSYELLKGVSRYKMFVPCLHEYRLDHVKSPFMQVPPAEWAIAVSLPVAQFVKGGTDKHAGRKVWDRRVWGTTGKKRTRRKTRVV